MLEFIAGFSAALLILFVLLMVATILTHKDLHEKDESTDDVKSKTLSSKTRAR